MDLAYTYFAFSAFFNAIVSTIMGFLILSKDRKNKVNQKLGIFSFGVALWSYAYIIWPLAHNRELTLFSFQLLHIPACFVSIFYLHFVVDWLGVYKKHRAIIWAGYLMSVFFSSLTFSTEFIADMIPKFSMRFWAIPGILYHYYLLMFFSLFLYSSCLLFINYFKERGEKKKQILLMLVGIGLSFLGGSTNYFLWYGINIPPYGNILASSFVIFTTYAIVRYNLLNIKLIATEGALLVMNTLFIFRFIVSRDIWELVLNIIILLGSLALSYVLIRSVQKEIQRREEVTQLAQSLEQANLRLKELDQQKTEFLSIASHQLRTPLSITKGYIELIQDGAYGKIGAKLNSILNDMDTSNERLVKLIDEFLDVTRIEQGRTKFVFEKKDIKDVVESVVKELHPKAEQKQMSIKTSLNTNKTVITFDEEKIRHVVFNFVDNAIKYSEKGVIQVVVEEENGGLSVKVQDTGIGFDKVDGANFFQKFYRGENVKGTNVTGTGLGIYVCRKFVENHNGRVWATSTGLGKGSEFGFWIPFDNKVTQ